VLHGLRHAATSSASLKQKTYFGLHELRNLLGEQAVNGIRKQPLRPSAWRKALIDHRRLLRLRRHPFVLYEPDASAFGCDASKRLIFDTILLNHPGSQLGPDAIESLYRVSGLLLAHVYLSCRHDYALDGAVEYHRGTLRLGSNFEANLQHLGERQRRGEIVTLSVAALRNALLAHARADVRRTERGWILNSGNEPACLAGDTEYVKRLVCCNSEKRIAGRTGYLVVRSSEPVELFESCSAAELELV
jgi:hypothetical protein